MRMADLKTRSRWRMLWVIPVVVALFQGGCSDYIPEKTSELQAKSILNNLSRLQPTADPNIPVPEVYRQGPRIVRQVIGNAPEWKLFYFCRYHTARHLEGIINAQFAMRNYDPKGNVSSAPIYTLSANTATNQIIARAPTEADITAVLDLLNEVDVPPVQVRIDCLISELYASITMDKEVTAVVENLFGEGITLSGDATSSTPVSWLKAPLVGGVPTLGPGMTSAGGYSIDAQGFVLDPSGSRIPTLWNRTFDPAFPGASLRDPARRKFGLKAGFGERIGMPGEEFRALVDLLISKGYLKILMNPTLEVINGQSATIVSRDYVPLQQVFIGGAMEGYLRTQTDYRWIVDSLTITPHVYADGYIGLETSARIGAKLTPEGIVQNPIITERTITNRENRIRHGESLIIGGIRKTEERDVIRGVPVLKDIPLVGGLFSGRDFEQRGKEVLFILTPTISIGGRPNAEVVEEIREKHRPPLPDDQLHKTLMDPFGLDTRERERQRQLLHAEESRMEAEAVKAVARRDVYAAEQLAAEARREAALVQAELERVRVETEKTLLAAARLKAEAEKQAAEAREAKAAAEESDGETSGPPPEDSPAPPPKP